MKIYLICFLNFLIISNFKLFMDTQEYVIEFLSDEWIRNIAVTTICIFLFVGAVGKSAQIGLHT